MGKPARLTKDKPKCKECKSPYHYKHQCWSVKKKPIKSSQKPLKRTELNKRGKVAKANEKTSREFWKRQKPNHQGYYECYLCKKWLKREEAYPEHMDSKTRNPSKRHDQTNLKVSCATCNKDKGSLSVEEYQELQRDLKNA